MKRIPRVPQTYRFPYGTCSNEALDLLEANHLPAIQWDVVTGDPAAGQSAEAIAKIVLTQTRPGSIIIAHANGRGRNTAKALPMFIPALKEKGFEFVTVSQLLQMGTPKVVDECYELKPGDNTRYDKLFGEGTE